VSVSLMFALLSTGGVAITPEIDDTMYASSRLMSDALSYSTTFCE